MSIVIASHCVAVYLAYKRAISILKANEMPTQNSSVFRAIIPVILALCALAVIVKRQGSVQPSQRRLSLLGAGRTLGDFADPKTSLLRSQGPKTYMDLVNEDAPLPQYSLKKAINAADLFTSRYAILRYDPASDKFIAYYSNKHLYVSGCGKLNGAIHHLTMILRALFPHRFTPDSQELVLAIQAGDYPDTMPYRPCVVWNKNAPCTPFLNTAAPILAFGSVYAGPLFPNMMGLPMPGTHLGCFLRWAQRKEVCDFFQNNQELPTVAWDQLKPQLVSRYTDFNFISIQKRHERPSFETYYLPGQSNPNVDPNEAATAMLKENFSNLLPRWKGAVLTAESEIEARNTNTLPKVNIKFPRGSVKDRQWEESGWPGIGERMDKSQLSSFKYHIDVGGGGGTTWSGTVDKLKMPGLLFHHQTVTKDYIHDDLQPWVHYVPVNSELSDVMEKLEWAESHQEEAKQIAENASRLMAYLSSPEGFKELFEKHVLNPLVKVIEAYQPLGLTNELAWNEAFVKLGGDQFTPLLECTADGNCHYLQAAKSYDERDPSHTTYDKLKWGDHQKQQ